MAKPHVPWVLLLDLDGTIVGDVDTPLEHWNALQGLHPDGKIPQASSSMFDSALRHSLQQGLLRPGFGEFARSCVKEQHGLELFVATMSTADWAPVVVSAVQAVIGGKMLNSRQILTREVWPRDKRGNQYKSVATALPLVFKSLRRKYGLSSQDQLEGRLLLIDNTDILAEQQLWVPCPTYSFYPVYDCIAAVSRGDPAVTAALAQRMLPGSSSPDAALAAHYQRLHRLLQQHAAKNQRAKCTDRFWHVASRYLVPALVAAMAGVPPTSEGRHAQLTDLVRLFNQRVLHDQAARGAQATPQQAGGRRPRQRLVSISKVQAQHAHVGKA